MLCVPLDVVTTVESTAITPDEYVIPVPPLNSASTLAPTALLKSVICELGIAMLTSDADVICPWAFTATCGTAVALPYVAALTPLFVILNAPPLYVKPVDALRCALTSEALGPV